MCLEALNARGVARTVGILNLTRAGKAGCGCYLGLVVQFPEKNPSLSCWAADRDVEHAVQ